MARRQKKSAISTSIIFFLLLAVLLPLLVWAVYQQLYQAPKAASYRVNPLAPAPTSANTPTPPQYWIAVKQPNGGETLVVNQNYTITWNATGNITGVDLYYISKGNYVKKIVTNTPNTGSYTWLVNTIYPNETLYKIRAQGYEGSFAKVQDDSDDYFTITTATPTLPACNSADINKDGAVDRDDTVILVQNYFSTTPVAPRADINVDGIVDLLDYSILAAAYNTQTGPCQ